MMKKYKVEVPPAIEKKMDKLPERDREHIRKKIDSLAYDPYPSGIKKLRGKKVVYYRFRYGDYRIIYSVKNEVLIVLIVELGKRNSVYNLF